MISACSCSSCACFSSSFHLDSPDCLSFITEEASVEHHLVAFDSTDYHHEASMAVGHPSAIATVEEHHLLAFSELAVAALLADHLMAFLPDSSLTSPSQVLRRLHHHRLSLHLLECHPRHLQNHHLRLHHRHPHR